MNIEDLLYIIKEEIENMDDLSDGYFVSQGTNNGFERLVPIAIEIIKEKYNLTFEYHHAYGHTFPDIDIILNGQKYGLELKSRNNETWVTNGNSVFESISSDDYSEIFLLFGSKVKRQNKYLIRFAPYWSVASGISVTHSPRMKIDMDTKDSVFSDANAYNKLRSMNEEEKTDFLQNYLRTHTTGTKWFISPQSTAVTPIPLNTLSREVRQKICAEVLVLFPQDLIRSSTARYARAHEFIITQYFYYSSSFRDLFSAGGKITVNAVLFPQIIQTLSTHKEDIKMYLNDTNPEFQRLAYDSWKEIIPIDTTLSMAHHYDILLKIIGDLHFLDELEAAKISSLSYFLD